MDKKVAAYLVASLLERVDQDKVGTTSGLERDALDIALNLLSDGDASIAPALRGPKAAATETQVKTVAPRAKTPVNRTASSTPVRRVARSSAVIRTNDQGWSAGLSCSVTRIDL